jgi:hypothetical protein
MSPIEALVSAASPTVKVLRPGKRGEVAPDKKGDLVMFGAADPTTNIGDISSIDRICEKSRGWCKPCVLDRQA